MTAVSADGRQDGPVERHFRQFLLKVHSRCNLDCGYCYVYKGADQSWRGRPLVMSTETIDRTADRIGEHARGHGLDEVRVILHGGEPLLAGSKVIGHLISAVRGAMPRQTNLQLTIQTNGVLLDKGFLDLFAEHDVRVGVSLDGSEQTHDRHRRHADGRGSYQDVGRRLRLLQQDPYRRLYAGLLCTVDVRADPVGTYEALLEFAPPMIDLLLPHATWAAPPPGHPDGIGTPYADWLIAVFEQWYPVQPQETSIRLFEAIMKLSCGGRSDSEAVGLSPVDLVVVETDGSIELADSLKVAYPGATATGLTVTEHSFDSALDHSGFRATRRARTDLCPTCQRCRIVKICGGGQHTHRYRPDAGFDNPSVYCRDLYQVIRHIHRQVRADVDRLRGGTS